LKVWTAKIGPAGWKGTKKKGMSRVGLKKEKSGGKDPAPGYAGLINVFNTKR